MSARPPWRSTWRKDDGRRRRAGGSLLTITPTPSRRSTCSWCRRSRLGLRMGSSSCGSQAASFCGGRDSPSQCGMACPSADRGLRLGRAPRYVIRDRAGAYGPAFIRRIRAMGIRERPVSARSPWQSGDAERLIGSIRRECLDHLVVVGERHLRHVLALYKDTTTRSERTYRCRKTRDVCRTGRVRSSPILGGLHHQYVRV
jgi:hypothetical protein